VDSGQAFAAQQVRFAGWWETTIHVGTSSDFRCESAISDFNGFKSSNGFQQLLDRIENWDQSAGSGSAPTSSMSYEPRSPTNFTIFGFDPGWHSHMIETLASFADGKGGPSQETPFQTDDQASQGVLAGTTPNHS
jgi:hypothetical protein